MSERTVEDITIPVGQTFEMVVDILGGPVSLVGYTGAMMVRELRFDEDPVAVVGESSFSIDALNRQLTVRIASEETEAFAFRRGVYDIIIIGPTGDQWRLVEGRVVTSLAVTRED